MLWDLTKRIDVRDSGAVVTFICNRATVREHKEARKMRLDAQRVIMQAVRITDTEEAIKAEAQIQKYQDAFIEMLRPMIVGLEVAKNGAEPQPVDDWEAILDEKTDLLYEHYGALLDSLFFRSGGIAGTSDSGYRGPGARPDDQAGADGDAGQADQGLRDDVPSAHMA
jgi:hypothetical protein